MSRRASLVSLLLAGLVVASRADSAATAPPRIQFELASPAREALGVSAVAIDPVAGRLAFGDARHASVRAADGTSEVVFRRGPVRALAFAADGALLVGTADGVERIDTEGRRTPCALDPGEAEAPVSQIAAGGGSVAVATARGAFVSHDGCRFAPLLGLPAGPVDAVSLDARNGGARLLIAAEGTIYQAELDAGIAPAGVLVKRSEAFEGRALERATFVAFVGNAAARGEAVAASADALAIRAEEGAPWRTVRLSLPPGANVMRAARALGRVWVATDRGLLSAQDWDAPLERAATPAGVTPVLALAAAADALYVGTARGLLVGRVAVPPAVPAASGAASSRSEWVERLQSEPPVRALHAAAMRYLDLGTGRTTRLRYGVDHRGLLPIVSLHLGREISRSRALDYDESYVSGGLRRLNDRARDRGKQVEAGLSFSWDLGDAAFHPEAIDLSRETREVIELRDDVLDEITQLYFERRRVLVEVARLDEGPETDAERIRLLLRAEELAAGLDAWTGGWFSRSAGSGAP